MSDCIDYGGIGKRFHGARREWEKENGPIPDGLWLLHSCDNPRCINKQHWFLGNASQNTQDGVDKGRIHGWNCIRSNFTDQDIRDIRAIPREEIGDWHLAEKYGVNQITITRIRNRDTWRWIE